MKTLLCLFIATVFFGCVPKNDITLNFASVSTPQTNDSNIINGCTDHLADNYDSSATTDDNSCIYSPPQAILGSTPSNITSSSSVITNFTVLFSNGLDGGEYKYKIIDPSVHDCNDPIGYSNFISTSIAISDDVSSFSSQVQPNTKLCLIARSSNLKNPNRTQLIASEYTWNTDLSVSGPTGCMDISASNYDSNARVSDGSCTYNVYGCMDPNASNYNPSANNTGSSTCTYNVYGCTNQSANNYNPNANADDGSCVYVGNIIYGCTNSTAINYSASATSDDGSCAFLPHAYITNAPSVLNISTTASMEYVTVTSSSSDSHYYRYKVFSNSSYSSCSDPMNYSSFPILLSTPIYWTDLQVASIGSNSSSPNNTICVVVDDASGSTHYENPTSTSWLADYQAPSISGMEVDSASIPNPVTSWSFGLATNPQSEMLVSHYKYKLVANNGMSSCSDSNGYTDTASNNSSGFTVSLESFGMGTGDVLMCILAVDYAGNTQSVYSAYNTVFHFEAPTSSGGGGPFSAGDGSDANPYEIWTAADLEQIRTTGDYSYKLMADIDLTGVTFSPLFETNGFSKTFDGNNHTISHWVFNDTTKSTAGFFSKLNSGANIKNLTLSDSSITAKSSLGLLVGNNDGGNISNCHIVTGEINAPTAGDNGDNVGGMVGISTGGSISRSSVSANITARYVVGGLVGSANGTIITESHTGGNVQAYNSYVGGLVGWFSNSNSSYIANSFSGSNVDSHSQGGCHGGFIGYLNKQSSTTTISNSYSSANMLSFGGGFAGCVVNYSNYAGYAIANSFSVGQVQSSNSGFANSVDSNILFSNVYFDMTSSGQFTCYPSDPGGSCNGIYGNSNYFLFDLTNHAPTLYWDFGSIWQTDNSSLPTLRNNP